VCANICVARQALRFENESFLTGENEKKKKRVRTVLSKEGKISSTLMRSVGLANAEPRAPLIPPARIF
jgi:hypothetical protein